METAYFAGGCFWGVQHYFDQMPGVVSTEAGYMGGHVSHPTYEQVCTHTTGHAETVKIEFDSKQVSYETLVRQFFRMHNPTQRNRQGSDVGDNYRSAIFYNSRQQKQIAKVVIDELNTTNFNGKIVTELAEAGDWWSAEAYHQKYAERTGQGMCHIAYAPIENS
ncbi:MAG TPA: peptide-methionine (S)-S-oxide reductase MsrA [Candidatus Saccharimonadales bacterium]